jgi:threonine dehydrogenase-like Zn-dependent dehydrogenase
MRSMRALVFDGKELAVAEREAPPVADGQVRVRPLVAGICNTDLEITRGYMGFTGVLGHEVVGVVEEGPWRGKRVVAEINFACGRCTLCARSLGRHCPTRTVMGILRQDGAFAEQVAVPMANLHEVPDEVSDERAVFVEPLAAAFEVLEQVRLEPGCEALVLGDGKLGLLVAQVLACAGASVLLVGKHAAHLDIVGARGVATVELARWDRTPRDLVVEATGSAEGFALAVTATRPRGQLVLKSTVAGSTTADLAPLVIHEISVVGSRCGPFAPALAALSRGSVEVEAMIEARFALADGVAAFSRAREPGALKVLLRV